MKDSPFRKILVRLFFIAVVFVLAFFVYRNLVPVKQLSDQGEFLKELSKQEALIEKNEKDSDGDGLPDWEEYLYGSDPERADTDRDGMNDGDEVAVSRDPSLRGEGDFENVEKNKDSLEQYQFSFEEQQNIIAKLPEIIFSPDDPEEKELFRSAVNSLGQIIAENEPGDAESNRILYKKVFDRDYSLEDLILISLHKEAAEKTADQIRESENTPNTLIFVKENLAQSYDQLGQSLGSLVEQVNSSEEVWNETMNTYALSVSNWHKAVSLVAARVDASGTEFGPSEPGHFFVFGAGL